MEIELIEIRDFIAANHPFDLLPIESLNALTEKLEVRYIRRDQCFPPENSQTPSLYMIRSGAIELRDSDNQLVARLGEGEIYTSECQLIETDVSSCHLCLEDSLIYQLPCLELKSICEKNEDFNQFFAEDLTQRLQKAARYSNQDVNVEFASMTIPISDLVNKEPVLLDSNATIQQAAQTMAEQNVSSIMLTKNHKLVGILTDRDLRKRCVAKGLPVEQSVSTIMSANLEVLGSDRLVLDALMLMTRSHINHLPIVDEGKIMGMLTASDLTRHSSANPAFMTSQIRKSRHLDELKNILLQLPDLQLLLANSNITARHIGETVSSITDTLTIRLIELAQQQLGPEPVPFVWVSGGSQARHEQSSHSDQDNALIIADEVTDEQLPYFHQLAKYVCDGLDACGFVYCPGDAMAMNDKWCQPYKVWKKYFQDWIQKPEPMALMLSSIFFDLRPVHGKTTLHRKLMDHILELTQQNSLFIAHMASNVLSHRPPVGFFRTFVLIHDGEHDNTFDIKHRGIVPITDIARVLALAEGIQRVNTSKRLKALAGTSSMSTELSRNLQDALEFIASLRIRHQANQIRRQKPADNFLPPDKLSSLERKHLKDAFEIIKDAQEALQNRYQLA